MRLFKIIFTDRHYVIVGIYLLAKGIKLGK